MAKITVTVRLPYEDAPREITVEEQDYRPGEWGVIVVSDGIQTLYPWHKVDLVVKPVVPRV